MELDGELRARLLEAGVDPNDVHDPGDAWRRLRSRVGRRATLIDRYALEAAYRGIPAGELPRAVRAELSAEVLREQIPELEFVPGSGRVGTDTIAVAAYDESWPERFAEWQVRLSDALGAAALRIEHVGSTAVDGLAAKPIIDIQVSVADVEHEATYVPAIESAGVPLRARERGHRYFRPSGAHARRVHIHVCEAGSAWEREHLLFRDYLRTHLATRDAYGRLKHDLAERYPDDRLAYTDAKSIFILDTLEDADSWAARIGWALPPLRS